MIGMMTRLEAQVLLKAEHTQADVARRLHISERSERLRVRTIGEEPAVRRRRCSALLRVGGDLDRGVVAHHARRPRRSRRPPGPPARSARTSPGSRSTPPSPCRPTTASASSVSAAYAELRISGIMGTRELCGPAARRSEDMLGLLALGDLGQKDQSA